MQEGNNGVLNGPNRATTDQLQLKLALSAQEATTVSKTQQVAGGAVTKARAFPQHPCKLNADNTAQPAG